ncbi:unnamed protein product [Laminaria digitata]
MTLEDPTARSTALKNSKEKPLDGFTPTSYAAILEGTLLTNGDLKGLWRAKRGDHVKNEFFMVLMNRGMYDGGFNIRMPVIGASKPAVSEIHDEWHSLEWCETTKAASNLWGRGRNSQFGECYLIGVHEPRQRRVVMYKVGETEMLRARAFARAPSIVTPPPAKPCPVVHTVETPSARQKRPRAYSETGEITAAAMLLHSAGGHRESSQSPQLDRSQSARVGNDQRGMGSSSSSNRGSGGSGGSPATGDGRAPTHSPYKSPNDRGMVGPRVPFPVVHSLPGFSGCFKDSGRAQTPTNVDELADLTILGGRLQKEKMKIQEEARAQRIPVVAQMIDYEKRLEKGKADEAMMLRALQEIRQKTLEDERHLNTASQLVKSYEADEKRALKLWNDKWETQVAPYIAQCEQGVKKRARDLENKTREAERERSELERELAHLNSVKQICDGVGPDSPV